MKMIDTYPRSSYRYPSLGISAMALAWAVIFAGSEALEAQVPIPAPQQSETIALTGGTIHTVSDGVIEGGTLVFEDGVITAVGSQVDVPAGARTVDVSGKHVYPGLIDGFSAMGLYEIGQVDVTVDLNELGSFNPNVLPEVAVNPESRHIGTARSNGVLVTVTTPSGGRVPGLSSALQLDGWTWEDLTLESGVALNVNWPNPGDEDEYEEEIREIREIFASARAYRDAHAADPDHDTDSRWEAMIPAVEGAAPVVVSADEVRQIQDAVTWAEEECLQLVLRGGRDALYVADHLAEKEIPLLLTSVMSAPGRSWEPYDGAYALPAELHRRGVRFAITGGSSAPYANRLPYEAGSSVAFGLPEEEAVRAVTLYPARFLGIDHRVGSLEVGKDATLLITTGHVLDYLAQVEQAYIQGREIDMTDIHRWFYEKYSEKVRQRNESGGR